MAKTFLSALSAVIFIFLSSGPIYAEEEGMDITIYNDGFALIRDRRALQLDKGINQVRFSGVAGRIEPTSAHFKSLTDPTGCVVQEQSYEYDLSGAAKLLGKYINKKIKVISLGGSMYEGTLLSYDNDNIVISNAADKSVNMLNREKNVRNIEFPEPLGGLVTSPTLIWQVSSDKKGRHVAEASYMTKGIGWTCDYVAVMDSGGKNIDLSGWITIDNKSGTSYMDASLKLMAGKVRRAEGAAEFRAKAMGVAKDAPPPQFEEKSFFEYHIYTLQRRATIKDNQATQIALLSAADIPVSRIFIYDPFARYGWDYYNNPEPYKDVKARASIEAVNSQKNNLGMALPQGKVKVYKKDSDGKLEFIGEDAITHTPNDEKIRLYVGDAFDVVGERKRQDYRVYSDAAADETIEITLRNRKEEDIKVTVVEHFPPQYNWNISEQSHEFTKKDAQTIEFKVQVPKNDESKITYKAHYSR